MRLCCALLPLTLLTACDDGGAHPADAAPPPGPLALTAQVEATDGTLVPLTEGAEVPYVWGLQGGTMLRPAFAFAPGAARVGEVFDVRVEHSPDPAAPAEFGDMGLFDPLSLRAEAWAADDGSLRLGPFNHQLGWDDLADGRLTYALTVTRAAEEWTQRLTLRLVSEDRGGPCDDVPTHGGYRRIAGTLHVTRLEPVQGACADAVSVFGRFTASDITLACLDSLPAGDALRTAEIMAVERGQAACLADAGLTVGADVPAVAEVIEHGTSTPWLLAPDLNIAACADAWP